MQQVPEPVCLSPLSVCLSDGVCVGQVVQSQEKMCRLEQEKEHWLLEAQLGQVRLQKESQRIAQLEAQILAGFPAEPHSAAQILSGAPAEPHSAADGPGAARPDSPEPVQDTSLVSDPMLEQ